MMTCVDMPMNDEYVIRYISSLVNRCFKILPMREENESSINEYTRSLLRELVAFGDLFDHTRDHGTFVSLLCVVKFLDDNVCNNECSIKDIRREVFNAISLCKKLKQEFLDFDETAVCKDERVGSI